MLFRSRAGHGFARATDLVREGRERMLADEQATVPSGERASGPNV